MAKANISSLINGTAYVHCFGEQLFCALKTAMVHCMQVVVCVCVCVCACVCVCVCVCVVCVTQCAMRICVWEGTHVSGILVSSSQEFRGSHVS